MKRQLQTLINFQAWIMELRTRLGLPLVTLLLHFLDTRAVNARTYWLPQTYFRELTLLEGAMKNLGRFLANNADISIQLTASAQWRAAKKAWSKMALQHQPIHQSAATFADIKAALNETADTQIRAFLMLLWLLCARKGDIAKLQLKAVSIEPSGRINAGIRQGKGVAARKGLYQLTSHCPPEWMQELQDFLVAPRPPGAKYLFRKALGENSDINNALRTANASLSTRSVRRGAIQTMAMDPRVDEATLMKLSGHKRVETLHRYLDWDRINERSHFKAQQAARNLTKALSA